MNSFTRHRESLATVAFIPFDVATIRSVGAAGAVASRGEASPLQDWFASSGASAPASSLTTLRAIDSSAALLECAWGDDDDEDDDFDFLDDDDDDELDEDDDEAEEAEEEEEEEDELEEDEEAEEAEEAEEDEDLLEDDEEEEEEEEPAAEE